MDNGQDHSVEDLNKFEHGKPSPSPPSKPTAPPIAYTADSPNLSSSIPAEKADGLPTAQQTAESHRWNWWHIVLGKRDTVGDSNGKGWKGAIFVIACEFGERASSFGLQENIINYFIFVMNMSLVDAQNLSSNFFGASAVGSLAGAFIADCYIGRYLTVGLGGVIYCLGLAVLALAASTKSLKPESCTLSQRYYYQSLGLPPCQEANGLQMGVLYLALALQCVGSAMIRPCVIPFGADQFDRSKKKHESQLRHYFNWFYMVITIAMVISLTLFVWIQDNVTWGWGITIPAIVQAAATIVFLLGTHYYVFVPPYGSPLTRMAQVVVAAIRKRKCRLPEDPNDLYRAQTFTESLGMDHEGLIPTDKFRCLDKAAVVEKDSLSVDVKTRFNPWRLATMNQVEELKQLLKMLPVFLSSIVVSVVTVQAATLVIQQSVTMNRTLGHFDLPPASIVLISFIAIMVFIPLYDLVLIKILRKFTKNPRGLSYLQRIGAGLFLNIFVMVTGAAVEAKRRSVGQKNPLTTSPLPISVFWLTVPLVLAGITEAFALIGLLEFFYEEAPKTIRSMSTAFLWASLGVGGFLSTALVSLVQGVTKKNGSGGWLQNNINEGHLDYFYWLLAVLSALNYLYYLAICHRYVYKKTTQDIAITVE